MRGKLFFRFLLIFTSFDLQFRSTYTIHTCTPSFDVENTYLSCTFFFFILFCLHTVAEVRVADLPRAEMAFPHFSNFLPATRAKRRERGNRDLGRRSPTCHILLGYSVLGNIVNIVKCISSRLNHILTSHI